MKFLPGVINLIDFIIINLMLQFKVL